MLAVKAFEERLNAESWVHTQAEWEQKEKADHAKNIRYIARLKYKDRLGLIIPCDGMKSVREIAQ